MLCFFLGFIGGGIWRGLRSKESSVPVRLMISFFLFVPTREELGARVVRLVLVRVVVATLLGAFWGVPKKLLAWLVPDGQEEGWLNHFLLLCFGVVVIFLKVLPWVKLGWGVFGLGLFVVRYLLGALLSCSPRWRSPEPRVLLSLGFLDLAYVLVFRSSVSPLSLVETILFFGAAAVQL